MRIECKKCNRLFDNYRLTCPACGAPKYGKVENTVKEEIPVALEIIEESSPISEEVFMGIDLASREDKTGKVEMPLSPPEIPVQSPKKSKKSK